MSEQRPTRDFLEQFIRDYEPKIDDAPTPEDVWRSGGMPLGRRDVYTAISLLMEANVRLQLEAAAGRLDHSEAHGVVNDAEEILLRAVGLRRYDPELERD